MEHSVGSSGTARMRVIYYAEPVDPGQKLKSVPDHESLEARWVTVEDLRDLAHQLPGLRGGELLDWAQYIEKGGSIAPLSFFVPEDEEVALPKQQARTEPVPAPSAGESKDGHSAELLLAVTGGDEAKVRQLLAAGCSPNDPLTPKLWTALHFAIKYQNQKIVAVLLESGSDISACTHKKRTCFHFAAQSTVGIVAMMLAELKRFPPAKQKQLLNSADDNGDTPLHFAARVSCNRVSR